MAKLTTFFEGLRIANELFASLGKSKDAEILNGILGANTPKSRLIRLIIKHDDKDLDWLWEKLEERVLTNVKGSSSTASEQKKLSKKTKTTKLKVA